MNFRKVSVIGCGFVGASIAFSLMQSGLFSEMVLLDVDKKRAEGEAMDIGHGIPFARPMKIYAGDYKDIADSAIIIITAGANQKPGETRIDIVKKNVAIFKTIIPQIVAAKCEGILLIVSNPVDILTHIALKMSGFPAKRVIGSGTVLDTARLKYLLGEHMEVDSRSVHAFVIGEHGDSELVVWSSANVYGMTLDDFCEMRGHTFSSDVADGIYEDVRDSAYEIIERKKATYYGIAMAVKRICECIIRNEKSIVPISSELSNVYGISDIAMSFPVILGIDGVENTVPIELSEEEIEKLKASADTIKNVIGDIEI